MRRALAGVSVNGFSHRTWTPAAEELCGDGLVRVGRRADQHGLDPGRALGQQLRRAKRTRGTSSASAISLGRRRPARRTRLTTRVAAAAGLERLGVALGDAAGADQGELDGLGHATPPFAPSPTPALGQLLARPAPRPRPARPRPGTRRGPACTARSRAGPGRGPGTRRCRGTGPRRNRRPRAGRGGTASGCSAERPLVAEHGAAERGLDDVPRGADATFTAFSSFASAGGPPGITVGSISERVLPVGVRTPLCPALGTVTPGTPASRSSICADRLGSGRLDDAGRASPVGPLATAACSSVKR